MFNFTSEVPERVQLPLDPDSGSDARFVLMPAWTRKYFGLKVIASLPHNRVSGKCDLTAIYMLFSIDDGECIAMIDGDELTTVRTVATSALAVKRLARPDSRRLFVLGTGRISSVVPLCFRHVLAFDEVRVWARSHYKADTMAAQWRDAGLNALAEHDLHAGLAWADVISTATPSHVPLVEGKLVRPGTHVNLVGSFTASMREADDDLIAGARLFVDSRAAYTESGDLLHPVANGLLALPDSPNDLRALCAADVGRKCAEEITVFKSVGYALEDLVAATFIYEAGKGNCDSR
jgi:ornithine cyclodeaminase/alanine dehydrogenase-like protein (mu-crystallin family)